MTKKLNGCHNRKPFAETYGGFGISSKTGGSIESVIPFVMAKDCQYTKSELGKRDAGCHGCKWRRE